MRYSRGQQSDRRELLALEQLLFKLRTLCYVFDYHQGAGDHAACGFEWSKRHIECQWAAVLSRSIVLIDMPCVANRPAFLTDHVLDGLNQVAVENIVDIAAQCPLARYPQYF